METLKTDVVVIGSGPGGYMAAIRLGQLGVKCINVEKGEVGGVCLNVGCIPSKAIIQASKQFEFARANPMGIVAEPKLDWAQTQKWKGEVVGKLTGGVKQLIKASGTQLVLGTATVTGKNRVEVKQADGNSVAIEAQKGIVDRDRLAADRDPRLQARRQAHLRFDGRAGARPTCPSGCSSSAAATSGSSSAPRT